MIIHPGLDPLNQPPLRCPCSDTRLFCTLFSTSCSNGRVRSPPKSPSNRDPVARCFSPPPISPSPVDPSLSPQIQEPAPQYLRLRLHVDYSRLPQVLYFTTTLLPCCATGSLLSHSFGARLPTCTLNLYTTCATGLCPVFYAISDQYTPASETDASYLADATSHI